MRECARKRLIFYFCAFCRVCSAYLNSFRMGKVESSTHWIFICFIECNFYDSIKRKVYGGKILRAIKVLSLEKASLKSAHDAAHSPLPSEKSSWSLFSWAWLKPKTVESLLKCWCWQGLTERREEKRKCLPMSLVVLLFHAAQKSDFNLFAILLARPTLHLPYSSQSYDAFRSKSFASEKWISIIKSDVANLWLLFRATSLP